MPILPHFLGLILGIGIGLGWIIGWRLALWSSIKLYPKTAPDDAMLIMFTFGLWWFFIPCNILCWIIYSLDDMINHIFNRK
jgi:hypothetical protein